MSIEKDVGADNPYNCPIWDNLPALCQEGRSDFCDSCRYAEQARDAERQRFAAAAAAADILSERLADDYAT